MIRFRAGLGDEIKQRLKTLQAAIPAGTIAAPDATGMRFEIAVTAYRRSLGCTRFTAAVLDAVRGRDRRFGRGSVEREHAGRW